MLYKDFGDMIFKDPPLCESSSVMRIHSDDSVRVKSNVLGTCVSCI